MKDMTTLIAAGGLTAAMAVSALCDTVGSGRQLDELRESVLRLHILANSDSERDQQLKLMVRDELIARSSEFFGDADTLDEAVAGAEEKLEEICAAAEEVLSENGCELPVTAYITQMYFDERQYGDMTVPEGEYTALRIEIGEAEGHNWWCVMYPQLCIPVACTAETDDDESEADTHFTEKQRDILYHPQRYRVKFAVWEKMKSLFGRKVVQSDENREDS